MLTVGLVLQIIVFKVYNKLILLDCNLLNSLKLAVNNNCCPSVALCHSDPSVCVVMCVTVIL